MDITGYGSGYGDGYGDGSGSGKSDDYADGDSDSAGSDYGYGYSDGSGYGSGSGSGCGYGSGYGYSDSDNGPKLIALLGPLLNARWVLAEHNAEAKRLMIEAMGPERFFSALTPAVVHRDVDGCGNPRTLLRIALAQARSGYLQAVRVVCPTTGRQYVLGVPPTVQTCQEAVASTFGLRAEEYHPERET